MVEISWTELAVQDLQDIFEFIANDSEKYALLTVNKIYFESENLEAFPEMGRVVPELILLNFVK